MTYEKLRYGEMLMESIQSCDNSYAIYEDVIGWYERMSHEDFYNRIKEERENFRRQIEGLEAQFEKL